MKTSKQKATTAIMVAGLVVTLGSIAMANSGGAADPLVSLSYLDEVFTPTMEMEAIDQAEMAVGRAEYNINQDIAALKSDLSNSNVSGASEFLVVTLAKGEKITLDSGAQAVLRVGASTVSAPASPALLNLSQGTSLLNGGNLVINQLYLAVEGNRILTASEDVVKIMVSGGFHTTST